MKKIIFIISLLVYTTLSFGQGSLGCIITNKPSGGVLTSGTSCTVDNSSYFNVRQTTAGQTITVPNSSSSTIGRLIYISNDSILGSVPFTIVPGGVVALNQGVVLRWQGTKWTVYGARQSLDDYLPKAGGIMTGAIAAGGQTSVDPVNRLLKNASGVTTFNWTTFSGYDSNPILSIDWSGRNLYKNDGGAVKVISWNTSELTEGNDVKINWELGRAYNSSGNYSINWETGQLNHSSGSSLSIDWDSRTLNDHATSAITLNWGLRRLYDEGSGVSFNWANRVMYQYDGTTTAIDYGNNTLRDPSNITSVYWSARQLRNQSDSPVLIWDGTSAAVEINSTTQGFLLPRMTTTQKNAISSPVAGLLVYDTTLNKVCVYTGSAWETITSL